MDVWQRMRIGLVAGLAGALMMGATACNPAPAGQEGGEATTTEATTPETSASTSKVPADIKASQLQKYIGTVLNDGTMASGIFEVGLGNNTEAEMITAFYNNFHEVLAGRKAPEDALNDLDRLMDKYRKK